MRDAPRRSPRPRKITEQFEHADFTLAPCASPLLANFSQATRTGPVICFKHLALDGLLAYLAELANTIANKLLLSAENLPLHQDTKGAGVSPVADLLDDLQGCFAVLTSLGYALP